MKTGRPSFEEERKIAICRIGRRALRKFLPIKPQRRFIIKRSSNESKFVVST